MSPHPWEERPNEHPRFTHEPAGTTQEILGVGVAGHGPLALRHAGQTQATARERSK